MIASGLLAIVVSTAGGVGPALHVARMEPMGSLRLR
jgi:ABC-type antimicrobial peptide transport system permease subunit